MRISDLNLSSRSRASVTATSFRAYKKWCLARITMACLVLAALGFVFAGRAHATPCWALATPSATRSLGPGLSMVESTSNGGLYEKSACHYWVVDISVPSDSFGASGDLPSFSIFINGRPTTKAACQSYYDAVQVYVKHPAQTQFETTPIAREARRGVWHSTNSEDLPLSDRCELRTFGTAVKLPQGLNPPGTGTDIYRVAGVVRSGSVRKRIQLMAQHSLKLPEPPK